MTNIVALKAVMQGNTIICSGSPAYSQQTITAQYNSAVNLYGASFSGCSGVTGTRYYSSGLSIIDSGTGTPNTAIPGNVNGSTSLGGIAN